MESDKDIVISGIGGRLPECDSVEEFMNALVNGVDLISETDRRHPPGIIHSYTLSLAFHKYSTLI